MMPFLLYQLKVALCIAVFTGFYLLALRNETFHAFNRVYLVFTVLLSLVIPAFNFAPIASETNGILPVILGAVTVYADKMEAAGNQEQQQSSVVMLLYLVVVLIYAGYFLFHLFHLLLLIRRNGISVQENHRLIELSEGNVSFSFFDLIFIQPDVIRSGQADQVIRHELAHARQLHSLDILLIQGIKIFQWFNPFMYVMEKTLKETHEYLADTAVLEQDGHSDRYRLLLLAQVFGVQPGIFSFFNRSLIKNRLTMMTKEKSPERNRLKYLAALPLVLILGLLMCCSLDKKEESLKTPVQEAAEKFNAGIDPASITDEDSVYVFVDEQALFQGGDLGKFREWVQQNVVYPPEAIKKGISGRVTVQFSVNSKGKLCDAKVLRGVDPLIDKATIQVIESSPDWIPGKYNGYNVKQQFVIPVIFMLQ
jgi:TonB family protein